MPKLQATICITWDVKLEDYESETIEQAAEMAQKHLDEGHVAEMDMLQWSDQIVTKIEPHKEI